MNYNVDVISSQVNHMPRNTIPTLDAMPAYLPWLQVVQTYAKCQRLLTKELRALDLSIAQHEVLVSLLREEGLSQQKMAKRLLATKSNVTGLLQRLVARDLVRREVDESDARGHCVYLTDAGRKLVSKAVIRQAKVVDIMTRGLSRRDIDTLQRLMAGVEDALDSALASP